MSELALSTEHEYLSFIVGREEFGVDILSVQEIRVWSTVTEIPNTPPYLKGVINLRGVIVPIIDLRQRFSTGQYEYDETTVVIVLQTAMSQAKSLIGIVVDAVADVHKVEVSSIKPAPYLGNHIDSEFIKGMSTIDEKIIVLLDVQKLLDVEALFDAAETPSIQAV
ncbi:MAG: chemotaxis protein CheW [Pseudohongiellaceae bacterium]